MRMRLSAVGVVLGALTCVPAVATAQDAGCTGEITLTEGIDGAIYLWSSSDPRLSGEISIDEGWSLYEAPSESRIEASEPGAYEIVNADGSWRCITSVPPGPEPDTDGHWLVFMGDGAYEDLHAFVEVDWTAGASPFTAFITSSEPPADPTLAG